jgi:hypothetical protein
MMRRQREAGVAVRDRSSWTDPTRPPVEWFIKGEEDPMSLDFLTPEELARLEEPYETFEGTPDCGPVLSARIEQPITSAQDLASLLLGSLDPSGLGLRGLGLEDVRVRVLIGDYLVSASRTVVDGLVDQLIAYRSWRRFRDITAEMFEGRAPVYSETFTPLVDVQFLMEPYHRRAFFAATGTTLDNLAATVVGVCALPQPIREASWGRLMSFLREAALPNEVRTAIDMANIDRAVERSGPPDWLTWSLETRNMMIHRPERVVMSRGRSGKFLARNPRLTDVEVMSRASGPQAAWLPEESALTIAGIRTSTLALTDEVASGLARVWRARLEGALHLVQPATQWTAAHPRESFSGYAPGSSSPLPAGSTVAVPPSLGRRMQAAGLMDDRRRHLWRT